MTQLLSSELVSLKKIGDNHFENISLDFNWPFALRFARLLTFLSIFFFKYLSCSFCFIGCKNFNVTVLLTTIFQWTLQTNRVLFILSFYFFKFFLSMYFILADFNATRLNRYRLVPCIWNESCLRFPSMNIFTILYRALLPLICKYHHKVNAVYA